MKWTGWLAVLVLWQGICWSGVVQPAALPPPLDVLRAAWELVRSGELGQHLLITAWEMVLGMLPAAVIGVALGVALGRSTTLRCMLDPPLMALNAAPRVALLPLLVIWLGVGPASKVWVAFLGAVLPIVINTQAGVLNIDPTWVRAAQSFGANRWQVIARVVAPAVLPAVLAGTRLGTGRAILGIIAGEMYVSTVGMGFLIQEYGNAGRTVEVLALGLVVTGMGALCVALLGRLEGRAGAWQVVDG